ncbi:MAG: anaerobic ribonucleoside-triphosphate reductase activating protein [Bacteroidales bacterium]
MIKTILLLKIVDDTIVDGPGFRTSIYAAGCSHRCKGCHNPHSWEVGNGTNHPVDEVIARVLANPLSNVTFTGGDPFFQTDSFIQIAKAIKAGSSKNIWCYTGYLFEDLLKDPQFTELLSYIDVLVDGPFELAKRDLSLLFRGSSNQRLVDVPKSLSEGSVVLLDYKPYPSF